MAGNPSYVYNIYTDIDRLHRVVASEDHKRGDGVTFALCHVLAGIMGTTEQSGVYCRVVSIDRVTPIMEMLTRKVFPDHCIEFDKAMNHNSYSFNVPGGKRKRVRFVLADDEMALLGSQWPVVDFVEGKRLEDFIPKHEVGEDGE